MRKITTSTGSQIELRTLADLMAMSDDELDARAWRSLMARQRRAMNALESGRCSLACLAAPDRWGECSCVCYGDHHGALWSTEIVPMGDWG